MSKKAMNWKRVHNLSGILLSLFIGFHLLNHAVAFVSEAAHIRMMSLGRFVYRNGVVEWLLLLAVVVQIGSGVRLVLGKRKRVNGLFDSLQIWTGLYLIFFLLIHVSAVLIGRFVLHLDTNLYFGAAGLNTFPLNLFFVPYYGLAIVAVFGHLAAAHYQKMSKNITRLSLRRQTIIFACFGIAVAIFILYSLTNRFSGMAVPAEYDVMVGK